MKRMKLLAVSAWAAVAVGVALQGGVARGAQGDEAPAGPLDGEAARAAFELEPGLAVELVAAEPLVESPCAVAWDEQGRMFVAENRGYPSGGPGGAPVGRIALLRDTDADGLPDARTDFATNLTFPNGVMPWRGGLIVTCAPDVLFLRDTDGDGVADVREVLLTGFATTGSTQLRVNDPTLGPDGWVYLPCGLSGGTVFSPKHPDEKLDLSRHDVKFRPDTGEIELVDGKGQFGMTFDDAGHRFTCYNRVQVQHAPLPSRYLERNPRVASPGVLHNCPELVVNTLLGLGSGDAGARIFPISSNVTTADSHAGTYSAACAVHVARGDALPAAYLGRAWSCDPTANLVRCDELVPAGGTFHAKRMHDGTEALRSRDDWFRPVFLADGPDGALYVCDMYRRTIEHPDYLPEEVRKRTDFEGGKGMGRIWRITRADVQPAQLADATRKNLGRLADGADLVKALASPDGWARDTAFRLITERDDAGLVPALAATAAGPSPAAAAASALNLLANRGALADATLARALKHPDAAVRETAVRFAEPRLANSLELASAVLSLAADEHVHVRYAVALALGEVGGHSAGQNDPNSLGVPAALAAIGLRDAAGRWTRAAILTSLPDGNAALRVLERLARAPDASDGALELLRDVAQLYGGDAAVGLKFDPVLTMLGDTSFDTRAAVLTGLCGTPAAGAEVRRLAAAAEREGAEPRRTFAEAAGVAGDGSAPVTRRLRAVGLLAITPDPAGDAALLALAAPEQPSELAVAAVRALAQPGWEAGVRALLEAERWQRYTPALRGTVIASVGGRPEFAAPLVDAIEASAVPVSALSAAQREWLKGAGDDALKARAAKLIGATAAGDRQQAFEKYKAALGLTPDPATGRRMFANHCASCHRLDREGVAVGPDLFGIRNQPKESILLHIVIPDQEVAPNFAAYECVTKDGRSLTGIVTAESPSAVTLRQVLGLEETIPRDQIERLSVSKFSLMPQGLEKLMTKQQMADLLAYLRGEQ
jgi:putative membrane-bound dehydrogenase-like protein